MEIFFMFAMTKSFENRIKNMIFNQLNTKHYEKYYLAFVATALFCAYSPAYSQIISPYAHYDSLQNFPFFFFYNCDNFGMYHGDTLCTVQIGSWFLGPSILPRWVQHQRICDLPT